MSIVDRVLSTTQRCGHVLLVEDDAEVRRAVRRLMVGQGYRVTEAGTTAQALVALSQEPIEVVVLDLHLPDGSGLDLLSRIGTAPAPPGVVVLTASDDGRDMREALRRGAEAYLRKPVDALTLEAQVSLALTRSRVPRAQAAASNAAAALETEADPAELGRLLQQLPLNLASQLSHAWDLRHVETGAHVRRMGESARQLALALGVPDAAASRLGRVAMLHDIGKIAIPDAILTKPGRLTTEEFEIMKRHSELGEALLNGSGHPFLDLAAKVARSHHERWNGTGYPDGLVGEACIWEARLVGVVDVYDALAQTRCYKPGWPRERIVDFFAAERGKSFDPEMTDGLLSIVARLELVKSQHPDPLSPDAVSVVRLKVEPVSRWIAAELDGAGSSSVPGVR